MDLFYLFDSSSSYEEEPKKKKNRTKKSSFCGDKIPSIYSSPLIVRWRCLQALWNSVKTSSPDVPVLPHVFSYRSFARFIQFRTISFKWYPFVTLHSEYESANFSQYCFCFDKPRSPVNLHKICWNFGSNVGQFATCRLQSIQPFLVCHSFPILKFEKKNTIMKNKNNKNETKKDHTSLRDFNFDFFGSFDCNVSLSVESSFVWMFFFYKNGQ